MFVIFDRDNYLFMWFKTNLKIKITEFRLLNFIHFLNKKQFGISSEAETGSLSYQAMFCESCDARKEFRRATENTSLFFLKMSILNIQVFLSLLPYIKLVLPGQGLEKWVILFSTFSNHQRPTERITTAL